MTTRILLAATLLAVFAVARAPAQSAQQYTYISDRKFTDPSELNGYDFRPAMREVVGLEPMEFPVGRYSFGITRKNLYVEGPEIQGVYSVNNINTTDYGFILKTMNARDPTIQGHLKIVVDDLGQVEALVFKRSNNDKEVIYFLRLIPEEVAEREAAYFTHVEQKRIPHIDSLWNDQEIRPFMRHFYEMGGMQERLVPEDSMKIQFYHVTTIEEKGKTREAKKADRELAKASGGKRKLLPFGKSQDAAPDATSVAMGFDRSEPATDTPAASEESGAEEVEQREPAEPEEIVAAIAVVEPAKEEEEDDERLGAAAFADMWGDEYEDEVDDEEITASTSREPIASSVPTDTARFAGVDGADTSYAAVDSLLRAAEREAFANRVINPLDTLDPEKKWKITTDYFVDLKCFVHYENGSAEMQHKTFKVYGMTERENAQAGAGGNRFQWELDLDKKQKAYVYLDAGYNVNSVVIDGQQFFMRGR